MSKRRNKKFRIRENKVNVKKSGFVHEKSGRGKSVAGIAKKTKIAQKEKLIVEKFVATNYRHILTLQKEKPDEWEGFSHNYKTLVEQIYHDRMERRKAAKYSTYSMEELLKQLGRTRLFLNKDQFYAQNMLKGMREHFPDDYKILTNFLNEEPRSCSATYDSISDDFVITNSLGKEIRVLVLYGLSGSENTGSGSNYIFEVDSWR